jgi:hypothetical protein
MDKVDLEKQASKLALRGIAAIESNDVDGMKFARLKIRELLSDLHDSNHQNWTFGLIKVANTIQMALERMSLGRNAVPRPKTALLEASADKLTHYAKTDVGHCQEIGG